MNMKMFQESSKSEFHTAHDHGEDTTPQEVRESAYRRGYQQALHEAINLLKAGGTLADFKQYMDDVTDWRFRAKKYRRARKSLEWPPRPKKVLEKENAQHDRRDA